MDDEISCPRGWWWYHGVTAQGVGSRLTENDARLTRIVTYMAGTSRRYAVTMVKNDGRNWWWYTGLSMEQVGQKAAEHGARITSLDTYEVSGKRRYTIVLGPADRNWWWYAGLTATQVREKVDQHKAVLTDIRRYTQTVRRRGRPPLTEERFVIVLVANPGISWWWYYGLDGGGVGQKLTENQAVLTRLESYEPAPGMVRYAAVMVRRPGAVWWWWTGQSAADVMRNTNDNCAYPIDIDTSFGLPEPRFHIVTRRIWCPDPSTLDISTEGTTWNGNSSVPVDIRLCPTAARDVAVALQSSHPTRLAGAQVSVPQGTLVHRVQLASGGECGEVVITATTDNGLTDSQRFTIEMAPRIRDFTPAQVSSCTPFELSIEGFCFRAKANDHRVWVTGGHGKRYEGEVLQVTPNPNDVFHGPTRLRVRMPGLEPGDYRVHVRYRNKEGVSETSLRVDLGQPRINSFSVFPSTLYRCDPAQPTIQWEVQNARTVKILRGSTVIHQQTGGEYCGLSGSFTDPVAQSNAVGYSLRAERSGATTAAQSIGVGIDLDPNFVWLNKVHFVNYTDRVYYIWLVDPQLTSASRLGQVAARAGNGNPSLATVTLADCRKGTLAALDQDSEAAAIQSSNWKWFQEGAAGWQGQPEVSASIYD